MAITKSKTLRGDERTVKVEWGGEVLTVSYDPNRITAGLVQEISELPQMQQAASIARQLVAMLTSWDLLEREPEADEAEADVPRVPITEEALAELGVPFLLAISKAVEDDQRPPAQGSFAGG